MTSTSLPLRVLVVHNAYQHRGGEDAVVESELALRRSCGHVVETFFRSNEDVAEMARLALPRGDYAMCRLGKNTC